MKILSTGFAGSSENINASEELITSLLSTLPPELTHLGNKLSFELIHCYGDTPEQERNSLQDELNRVLSKHSPTICLFIGQAPTYNRIRVERFATNFFQGEKIDMNAPPAYVVTLPGHEDLPRLLNERHLPASHSNYAGQHTCNHILFSSLHLAKTQPRELKAGFIHIPVLPEQVANASEFPFRDSPFMTLEQTRLAVAHIINHVARKAEL